MITVIICAVVIALAIMVVIYDRQSLDKTKGILRRAQEQLVELEQKVTSSRDELQRKREELERGKNELRETRELSKKKLRRQSEQEKNYQGEAVMSYSGSDDHQLAINALESQIELMKKEQTMNEEEIRKSLDEEFKKRESSKEGEIEKLKAKIAELEDDLKKKKRLLHPEGYKLDLKSLPDETAGEFARLFRKAEQHERLHGIARAKLQLAQEKFTDLQKRYFAVCRELALSMGKEENIAPKEAREVAEGLVAGHQTNSIDVAKAPADRDNDHEDA
jgi:DNA repair exonuclease SbcCD ATPase subunit